MSSTSALAAPAERIAAALDEHFDPSAAAVRQVLAVAEEAGEFVGAYRRAAGLARRAGSHADVRAELADVVTTAALAAAERGWHVFPLVPGGKRPAFPDHPAVRCDRADPRCRAGHVGWEQRATTDPDRIRRGWARAPFNVGIACGPSGLVVVDLDVPKTIDDTAPAGWAEQGATCGLDVLLLLADAAGQPAPVDTHTVTTPSGGTHLYYRAPDGVQLRNTEGETGCGLGWKVDTRAHGGYVVAAGSIINGRPYATTDSRDPVLLPGWLAGALTPAQLPAPAAPVRLPTSTRRDRYLTTAVAAELARVEGAPPGERNRTLYVAAAALGQLVAGGALTEDYVRDALMHAAAAALAAGAYSPTQLHATITSGLRAGAKRPRTVAA